MNRPNHVWVSNHTSMIDYIILTAYSPFAVIMQLHPGWVGFLQTKVLNCLGCLWFNRTEVGACQVLPNLLLSVQGTLVCLMRPIRNEPSHMLASWSRGICRNNVLQAPLYLFTIRTSVLPLGIERSPH